MGSDRRQRRWGRKTKPGDGRALQPFRWWQLTRRSMMSIALPDGGHRADYVVDVRHGGDPADGVVRARLYVDGGLVLVSGVPAWFPVPGGHIEVRVSAVGLRRCHFVADNGAERQLTPDPRSAEGRRDRFARDHPAASRVVALASVALLLVGIGLNALQAAEPISQIPPITDRLGAFKSPVHLEMWANIGLGLGAAFGALERATRLRYHWLLDSGAGT